MITIFISGVLVLIAYILWRNYGSNKKITENEETYPVEEYNSAEFGYLYYGYAENESIISLLLFLANKGYIKIRKSFDEFMIIKTRDYDGNNEYERMFFEELFKESNNNTVTKKSLYGKFYESIEKIREKLHKNEIYEKSNDVKKYYVFMIIFIAILITVKTVLFSGGKIGTSILSLITQVPLFIVLINYIFAIIENPNKRRNTVAGVVITTLIIIPITIIAIMMATLVVNDIFKQDKIALISYIFGYICIIALLIFYRKTNRRTPYGNKNIGKIRGFRKFIKNAKREELENLIKENTEYFYNVLPYTYAIGIIDEFINKFEKDNIQQPKWYEGISEFDIKKFIDTTMKQIFETMTYNRNSELQEDLRYHNRL